MRHEILSALVLLGLASCHPGGQSEVTHAAARPTRDIAPWQWTSVSREDFVRWRLEERRSLVFPDDNSGVVRAQAWVDKIDASIRARHPAALANVPTPKVLLVSSTEKNAQVSTLPLCFRHEVALASGRPTSGRSGMLFYGPSGFDVELRARDASSFQCLQPHDHHIEEILGWLRAKDPTCTLRLEGARIIAEENCTQVERVLRGVKATRFAVVSMANWIVLESALLEDDPLPAPFNSATPEERLVATLAHELGHYYGAHAMLFPGEFRFWYLRRPNENGRPIPNVSAAVEEQLQRLRECLNARPRRNCASVADESARMGLGWYTEEEEADDFALEALAELGLNLNAAAESHYAVGISHGWNDGERDSVAPGPRECASRRIAGWSEPPFLGTLADPHHGSCYRIFNLDREMAGHRYRISERIDLATTRSWQEVVAAVRAQERAFD